MDPNIICITRFPRLSLDHPSSVHVMEQSAAGSMTVIYMSTQVARIKNIIMFCKVFCLCNLINYYNILYLLNFRTKILQESKSFGIHLVLHEY